MDDAGCCREAGWMIQPAAGRAGTEIGDAGLIRVDEIRLAVVPEESEAALERRLRRKVMAVLGLRDGKGPGIRDFLLLKKSIDARKKPQLFYNFSAALSLEGPGQKKAGGRAGQDSSQGAEQQLLARAKGRAAVYAPVDYRAELARGAEQQRPEEPGRPIRLARRGISDAGHPPVIIGAGPAGLFCAYVLALAGHPPILIERGQPVVKRKQQVEQFFETGVLDPECNVQFGEGGAGTFSDGKLASGIKDRAGRIPFLLQSFFEFGAKRDILYDAQPHVGTDRLFAVVQNLHEELLRLGCEMRFGAKAEEFLIQGGALTGVRLSSGELVEGEQFVLAIGHSARDTFAHLHAIGIPMESKPFAVGLRVEHPQVMLDEIQYGSREMGVYLGASPYKLTGKTPDGRAVYSFCMCPGGYVVNASSEAGGLCVNGMSDVARDSGNANSAIVLAVGREDVAAWASGAGGTGSGKAAHPLSGVLFQRELEQKAFALQQGRIPQQLYGDFLQKRVSAGFGAFSSQHKGRAAFSDLSGVFPEALYQAFCVGMEQFGKKIRGFDREDAILSGIEGRTSCPLRILRDAHFSSRIQGLYPCGEGAGYAGGITSAAVDGMKVAEEILRRLG